MSNNKKNQNQTVAPMTLEQLQSALAAAETAKQKLAAENAKLRQGLGRRPADALVISTCLTFQKGTHQELVGKNISMAIPSEALGALFVSGEVKRNKTGNAYMWCTGWIDTTKLDLKAAMAAGEAKAAQKATAAEAAAKGFAETVGVK